MVTSRFDGKRGGRSNGARLHSIRLNGSAGTLGNEPTLAEQLLAAGGHRLEPARQRSPAFRPAAKLAGKVAIITGAERGLGRAVALAYAHEGADVAILYRAHDADAQRTREAVEACGRRASTIQGDISDETFCRDAVKQVVDELGRLDILVSNAAVQEQTLDVQTLSREQLERAFRVNVFGYIFMVQACLPFMSAGGAIIATGSEAGIFGSLQLPDYSATQGAIHALTRSLAQQLSPRGIRVNAVAPSAALMARAATGPGSAGSAPEPAQGELPGQERRRERPEGLAPAYVFFASNTDSGFITGQVLAELGSVPR